MEPRRDVPVGTMFAMHPYKKPCMEMCACHLSDVVSEIGGALDRRILGALQIVALASFESSTVSERPCLKN